MRAGQLVLGMLAALVVALTLSPDSASATDAARVKANTWTGADPSSSFNSCTQFCQAQLSGSYGALPYYGVWRWGCTSTSAETSVSMCTTTAGLDASNRFYGKCGCSNGAGGAVFSVPAYQLYAQAECPDSAETLLPSYYPASCIVPSGSAATGTPPAAGSCFSKLGSYALLSQNFSLPAGPASTLCYQSCQYQQVVSWSFTVVGTVAQSLYLANGAACAVGDTIPSAYAAASAPSSGGSTGGALETTQVANGTILSSILAAIRGIPAAPTATYTGGDLARGADAAASSAVSNAATATATGQVASALAVDPTLQAAGVALTASGAGFGLSQMQTGLPQDTVDFSTVPNGVTVSLFGAGSCPAPASLGDWNGQPISFDFTFICRFMGYLGALVVMAGAFTGFRVAMSG